MKPRFWLALLLLAGVAAAATPARADRLERVLLGLNGILTAPTDPVRHVVTPLEDFVEVPGYPYSARALGLVSGSLLATYRIVGGALDIAFAPLGVVPELSPEPHFAWLIRRPSEPGR